MLGVQFGIINILKCNVMLNYGYNLKFCSYLRRSQVGSKFFLKILERDTVQCRRMVNRREAAIELTFQKRFRFSVQMFSLRL